MSWHKNSDIGAASVASSLFLSHGRRRPPLLPRKIGQQLGRPDSAPQDSRLALRVGQQLHGSMPVSGQDFIVVSGRGNDHCLVRPALTEMENAVPERRGRSPAAQIIRTPERAGMQQMRGCDLTPEDSGGPAN
jgi:hypothetical protein